MIKIKDTRITQSKVGSLFLFMQGWKYLMLGAVNDHALSQMALAYRHFIGADGLHRDCDIAIGMTSWNNTIVKYLN